MENNKKQNNKLFIILAIISIMIGFSTGHGFSQILLNSFLSFVIMLIISIAVF